MLLKQLPHHRNSISASALTFAPDSSKLALAVTGSAELVVVDLSDDVRVLRIFKHHSMKDVVVGESGEGNERVIKSLPSSETTRTDEPTPSIEEDENEDENEDEDEDETMEDASAESVISTGHSVITTVICIVPSPDGQWLASADLRGRVHVFNLDSMQVWQP